jgi:hypothetical protein
MFISVIVFSICISVLNIFVAYYVYKLYYIIVRQYNDLPSIEYIDSDLEEEMNNEYRKNIVIPPQEYVEKLINEEEDGVEIITVYDELEQEKKFRW